MLKVAPHGQRAREVGSARSPRDEGIRGAFAADRGVGAVAADDSGGVGHGVKLLADRTLEDRERPAHEVGAADGSGKEDIADDRQRCFGARHDEGHAAGRVARGCGAPRSRGRRRTACDRARATGSVRAASRPRARTSRPAWARCCRARSRRGGARSAGLPRAAAASSAVPPTWSRWPWVWRIMVGRSPLARTFSAIRAPSSPGSMTASSPASASPSRTQFAWIGPTAKTSTIQLRSHR